MLPGPDPLASLTGASFAYDPLARIARGSGQATPGRAAG